MSVAVSFFIGWDLEGFECKARDGWSLEISYLNTLCISNGRIHGQGLVLFQIVLVSFPSQDCLC